MLANDIFVFFNKNPMPTPFLSYCTKKCECAAGIMITASHNPPEYNGYKCYNENGCQITEEISSKISEEMKKIDIFRDVKILNFKKNKTHLFNFVDDSLESDYMKEVCNCLIDPKTEDLRVTFTPLNGCSRNFISKLAKNYLKIKNFFVVKKQEFFDPDFTTCKIPNPELKQVFNLAIKLAQKTKSDIVFAIDPDGDRIGVCVRSDNKYIKLDGNQVAVLILDYILTKKKDAKNKVIIKSMVSTMMVDEIAKKFDIRVISVLTGFKYIGKEVSKLEKNKKGCNFLFGFEESCGYLLGNYVKDKDAISAFGLMCEIASFYKSLNINLLQKLDKLYKKYGYYKEKTLSFLFSEKDFMSKKQSIIQKLRNKKIDFIGKYSVSKKTDLLETNKSFCHIPLSDTLIFDLKNSKRIIIRASGTEPKLKVYILLKSETKKSADSDISLLEKYINNLILT